MAEAALLTVSKMAGLPTMLLTKSDSTQRTSWLPSRRPCTREGLFRKVYSPMGTFPRSAATNPGQRSPHTGAGRGRHGCGRTHGPRGLGRGLAAPVPPLPALPAGARAPPPRADGPPVSARSGSAAGAVWGAGPRGAGDPGTAQAVGMPPASRASTRESRAFRAGRALVQRRVAQPDQTQFRVGAPVAAAGQVRNGALEQAQHLRQPLGLESIGQFPQGRFIIAAGERAAPP